jgi:hypothetical protein
MSFFLLALLLIVGQPGCCRQSVSYPVMANVSRIEVVRKENVIVKKIDDAQAIDSIVRFIDERRSRWCAPTSTIPLESATLYMYKSTGGPGRIGLGKGFLVAELADGKYWLRISPSEQRTFFKLLDLDVEGLFEK